MDPPRETLVGFLFFMTIYYYLEEIYDDNGF